MAEVILELKTDYDINEALGDRVGPEYVTKIINRNFAGKTDRFGNNARTFSIKMPGDIGELYASEGWPVTIRELDDGSSIGFLAVNAEQTELYPHTFVQILRLDNGKCRKIVWPDDKLSELDSAQLKNIKLRLRARFYEDRRTGEKKIKAYLKTMYFELVPDTFDDEYDFEDMPSAPSMPFDTPWDEE